MNDNLFDQFDLEGIKREMGADDPARLDELERATGRPLPDDYRLFLLTKAPCRFRTHMEFRPLEDNPWARPEGLNLFQLFYGLDSDSIYDVIKTYNRMDTDFVPPHMLPIGFDPGASNIVMALDEPAGRIYFQDSDSGDFFLCANSFTDFLKSFEKGDAGYD